MEPTPATQATLTDDLRERLSKVAVATLSAQLKSRGYNNASLDGLGPLVPGTTLVGTARTLRFIPHRPDLAKARGGGYNAHKRIIDTVNPGEVIVMEARGYPYAGTLGDIMALRVKMRGAAGVVTDGAVRDAAEVASIGVPVFCQGTHPAVFGRVHVPWELDVTITCGGAAVQPGDVIVANDDGVLAFPIELAEELVEACEKQEFKEEFVIEMVKEGHSLDGLHPMRGEWEERFEQWAAER